MVNYTQLAHSSVALINQTGVKMLKRYVVFNFDRGGASGGWSDVLTDGYNGPVRSFETLEEAGSAARAQITNLDGDCSQVVDLHTGQIVANFDDK